MGRTPCPVECVLMHRQCRCQGFNTHSPFLRLPQGVEPVFQRSMLRFNSETFLEIQIWSHIMFKNSKSTKKCTKNKKRLSTKNSFIRTPRWARQVFNEGNEVSGKAGLLDLLGGHGFGPNNRCHFIFNEREGWTSRSSCFGVRQLSFLTSSSRVRVHGAFRWIVRGVKFFNLLF